MKGLLFVYALTYGGAAAALAYPFVGLLVYIMLAIIKPEAMWPWAIQGGSFSRIVGLALLAGWAFKGFGSWRFGRATGVVASVIGLAIWSILSALQAPDQEMAWKFVEDQSKIILPFVVGVTLTDSIAKLKQVAWVITLSESYVALELNMSYFSGYNQLQEEGFGGMDNNCNAIALVTCLGLAFFLGNSVRDWRLKALLLPCGVLMLHAILFSYSRGGMLGLLISAIATFLIIPKRPKHYLVFAAAVLLTLSLAGQGVRDRFMMTFASKQERDGSAESRLELWGNCWDAMQKRPLFGAGPDHWPLLARDEYGWGSTKEAHTLWLQTGAELGFPGLGFLVLFYGLCMARLLPFIGERRRVPDPWVRDGSRMVIVSLVGFCISASFVSLEALEVPYYVVLIGAGLLKLTSPPHETT